METNTHVLGQMLQMMEALQEPLKTGNANAILQVIAALEELLADSQLPKQLTLTSQTGKSELIRQVAAINRQNELLAQNGHWLVSKLVRLLSCESNGELLYSGDGRLHENKSKRFLWDGRA